MIPPASSSDERHRLETLRLYGVLDTPSERALDDLTALAAAICGTPIALISLVDEHRQWFKSKIGLEPAEFPREFSFCAHALGSPDLFIVPDAIQDERFAGNPLVTGEPHIRFYAGARLLTMEGAALGTLSVIDRVSRTLTPLQEQTLRVLAQQVMAQLDLRLQKRDLEERSRAIVESALDAIVTVGHENRITDFNPAAEKIFGWSRAEVMGREMADVIIPERLREAHRRGLARYLETGVAVILDRRIELTALRSDGTEFPVELTATRLGRSSPPRFTAFLRDITAQKKAEAAQRASEEWLRLITNLVPHGIFAKDAAGRYLFVNRALAEGCGFTIEEILKKSDFDLVAARAQAEAYRADDLAVLESGTPKFTAEEPNTSLAGRTRFFQTTKVPFTVPETGEPAVLGVSVDITGRKRGEEALRQSEERLRLALDAAHMGIYDWDVPADRIAWSRWHEEMWGYAPGEFSGTYAAFSARVHPGDLPGLNAEVARSIAAREPFVREFRVVWPDGSVHWIQARGEFAFDDAGRPVRMRGAVIETTARKEAEEEIHRLNAELEQRVLERTAQLEVTNKELESFSYSVSHDLRAPLRSIDGFSRILLEDYAAKLDEEGQDSLWRVRRASQRMGELIDDMLKLSRVTRSEMEVAPVDLSPLVRGIVEELQRAEPERHVEVVIAGGLIVQGDRALLQVAMQNLLGNAWKFAGQQPQARIEVGVLDRDGERTHFVRDNGAGFDMAFAGKLFGAFQRLHDATEFPGTGIGLATVQRVLHRHGGRIWAESAVGQGATFFFTLPEHPEIFTHHE